MGSTTLTAATATELRDHWTAWRPEWTPGRTCLYWYLTFRGDELARVLGEPVLGSVHNVDWLDAVPADWCHVTVADVGFTDEVHPGCVGPVTRSVADAMRGEGPIRLTLGPVQTYRSAVVLAVAPIERLRAVVAAVRRGTSAAQAPQAPDAVPARAPGEGPDKGPEKCPSIYWPHLSLGYVNRAVDADTVAGFLAAVPPVTATLEVDAVTLVAVTRRDHGYRWEVQAQVDLGGPGRPSASPAPRR